MLLIHQTGSVKIGEVVRYTVTYSPSQDRILPSPERLYVRIRNTSSIALRAAFVHGPYTLSVATYPAKFNPNEKFPSPRRYGVPEFEPMLKAGGSWECQLVVPEDIRQAAGTGGHGTFGNGPEHDSDSVSWVIEISSQVIFSTSAAVGYELLVGREQKSLSLASSVPVVGGQAQVPQPGKLVDHQQSIGAKDGHHPGQPRGVFSRAIHVQVEDTATLWNTPRLPAWDDAGDKRVEDRPGADKPVESMVKTGDAETEDEPLPRKQKKIHLVILTHGLHSNLGADMLFMKESIDAAAKQAKIDAKARRAKKRAESDAVDDGNKAKDGASSTGSEEDDEDEDEEVIVRGYSGNATKTEKGIKYLGKRLARYVLSMTYPDQPFLPIGGKGAFQGFAHGLGEQGAHDLMQAHKNSTIVKASDPEGAHDQSKAWRPYKVTSISFVAHSLGGLVQTYAIAYIQKHSPRFFDIIRPINFIALATPFLGLSNENPLYVKFALDFGLVGRTGKDLGLTWRAPTIARSGWGAIVSNLGESAHKKVYGETQPESKPLLRILPSGPAHNALKKFRNRTVYSNVVNDGIVPLRTSCLLFLDWQGLGRVGKARRDAGLVETVVGFGWAELTGANMGSSRQKLQIPPDDIELDSGATTPNGDGSTNNDNEGSNSNSRQVPQPSNDALAEDDRASLRSVPAVFADEPLESPGDNLLHTPLTGFFNLFRSSDPPKEQPVTEKQKRILRRSQTLKNSGDASSTADSSISSDADKRAGKATAGHELENDTEGLMAPPRTTFFESAGDLLNPKIPDVEWLIDPSKRPRTIFHDRVYHPTDIPAPPLKKRTSSALSKMKLKSSSSTPLSPGGSGTSTPHSGINHEDSMVSAKDYDDTANTGPEKQPNEVVDGSSMRVEEKISRGYHKDLSWRKVLVKLEPDAHNNIFVRRMFANAYGWPVIKHLVDAHFSDSAVSRLRTEDEYMGERALDISQPPGADGRETKTVSTRQARGLAPEPTNASEAREALDEVRPLPRTQDTDRSSLMNHSHQSDRRDSMTWSERDWASSENESDFDFINDAVGDKKLDKPKDSQGGRLSPSSWNWTEKIVGKGAMKARSKSPTTTTTTTGGAP
ncbi:putative serine esterase domain-containing protein [Trichoderma chlorosporum]